MFLSSLTENEFCTQKMQNDSQELYDIHSKIHMYSGITSGRVLDGELLYTKILEVNLFAFAYRLFHRDFSPFNGVCSRICPVDWREISMKQSVGKCKQINFYNLCDIHSTSFVDMQAFS